MSRKGENIYKRKDERWEGRYILWYNAEGKAKYGYVYARTYQEVKRKLSEKRSNTLQPAPPKSSMPYNDLLDLWLRSVRLHTKESTFARYAHLVDTHIRPALGRYPLCQISTQLVESFIEQQLHGGRLDHGGALAPKTVSDMMAIVKSSMEYARYNQLQVICNLHKLTIKRKEKTMRVLGPSEQDALVQVLLRELDRYKLGVLLSLYTGIRLGELCALRWENLCLTSTTLKVRETMQRIQDRGDGAERKTKVIITEPKSACSIRDIPLPPFLVQLAQPFSAHPQAFILSGAQDCYVEPRTMQNRFKRYVRESGIADANFHALRHTFATRCVEVGFELKSLSEILGHANVNITLNRYVHTSFDLKCSNMNKLPFPI